MQILRGRTTGIRSLAISPDSRYVVAGDEFCIHCWDLADPKCKPWPIAEGCGHIYQMQFTSASTLFANFEDNWCRYDLTASTGTIFRLPRRIGSVLSSSILHPTGSLLKTTNYDYEVETFSVGHAMLESLGQAVPFLYNPYLVNFDSSGSRYLASAFIHGSDNIYHLFESDTNRLINSLELLTSESAVDTPYPFSRDGRRVYVATCRRLLAFDCETGGGPIIECVRTDRSLHGKSRHGMLAVHPDGCILATLDDRHTVALRDAATLQPIRTYDFNMPNVTCVAFTPDGTRCVVGNSRGKVLLFDVE